MSEQGESQVVVEARAVVAAADDDETSTVGSAWIRPVGMVVLAASLVVLAAATVYCFWTFWPPASLRGGDVSQGKQRLAEAGTDKCAVPANCVRFLGYRHAVSIETRLFVIVALAGFLGALIHALRSLIWYAGNRKARRSWIPFYYLTPLIGAGLATVFYLVFRGGLFTNNARSNDINPWGFAAVGALVGLFSEEAIVGLKSVAEQLFAKAPQGKDHKDPEPKKTA